MSPHRGLGDSSGTGLMWPLKEKGRKDFPAGRELPKLGGSCAGACGPRSGGGRAEGELAAGGGVSGGLVTKGL